jgi:L,D-transpeptidase YcbB
MRPRAVRYYPTLVLAVALSASPATAGAEQAQQPVSGENVLRTIIEEIRLKPAIGVRGTRLIHPDAVARFFETRDFTAAWRLPEGATGALQAIRTMDLDGLTPADYHLAALTAALEAHAKAPSAETSAILQVLIADAAAAMADDVRYGRVRPATLDKRWNVDPRAGTPPLDVTIDQIARSASVDAGVEALKPTHFIYTGLKQALARVRAQAAAGGWPAVAPGAAIKPGGTDPRVAQIRKRLAATGELKATAPIDGATYDADVEAAVKNFQSHHRLADDGVIGKGTIEAMNVSAEARVSQLKVNLERARWVVGGLRDSFVLVNLPAFKAYVIRDRKNVWETLTQIGREARKTPTFRADMKYLVLNPDWTVPPTILAQDVLAGMRKGQNTIARKKLVILDGQGRKVDPASIDWKNATPANFRYTLRQPPGDDNALGRVKFIFPNPHSIFLHDTPSQELFASDQRTFSSGCIRVANALDLARVLLEGQATRPDAWTAAKIDAALASGQQQTVFFDEPLPVLIVYWTASIGAGGELRFARDAYGLDPPLLRALTTPR